jgi:hypothetical protein
VNPSSSVYKRLGNDKWGPWERVTANRRRRERVGHGVTASLAHFDVALFFD